MDYLSRFSVGLTALVHLCLYWNVLSDVGGQKLVRFGTTNNNDGNLYDLQNDFISNARLMEKKSIDEPYHEVYAVKDSSGGLQRIHYAVDNQGLRANFYSDNVEFHPLFDYQNLLFGTRLNNTTQTNNQQNRVSHNSENNPSLSDSWKSDSIPPELSMNASRSHQTITKEFDYLPLDFKMKRIPKVANYPTYYHSADDLSKVDLRNPAQEKIAEQVHGEPFNGDAIHNPYFDHYEDLLAPIDFLREKPSNARSQFLTSTRQISNTPEIQNHLITMAVSLKTPENAPTEKKNRSRILLTGNIITPLVIKYREHEKNTSHEFKMNQTVNKNTNLNSDNLFASHSKIDTGKDTRQYRGIKSIPISHTSLIKSPLSTIFDTSNKNGQYYRYAMNIGQTPVTDSQNVSAIYPAGNNLFKVLNQTSFEYHKIANEVFPSTENKTNLTIYDKISANSNKHHIENSYPVIFNSSSDRTLDETKRSSSLSLLDNEWNDKRSAKNVTREAVNAFAFSTNHKKSQPPGRNNSTESSLQELTHLTTFSDMEGVFQLNEEDVSTSNSIEEVPEVYGTTSTTTIPSTSFDIYTDPDLSNISVQQNYSSFIRKLTDGYGNNSEELITTVDISESQPFELTTLLPNAKELSYITNNYSLLDSNAFFDQSTSALAVDYKNILEKLTTVMENAITSHNHNSTTPFSAGEDISEFVIEVTTPFSESYIFPSKSTKSYDNVFQSEKIKPDTEENSTSNALSSELDLTLSTSPSNSSAIDFITDSTKYVNDSTTETALLDVFELNQTESTIQSNTFTTESVTLNSQSKVSTAGSLGKNGTKMDEIKIPLLNNDSSQKPILELIMQKAEMDDFVSHLNGMPMTIKIVTPQTDISLPIANEPDKNNDVNTVNTVSSNFSSFLNDNEADISDPSEKLMVEGNNHKL